LKVLVTVFADGVAAGESGQEWTGNGVSPALETKNAESPNLAEGNGVGGPGPVLGCPAPPLLPSE
jgi:hypothetical protein